MPTIHPIFVEFSIKKRRKFFLTFIIALKYFKNLYLNIHNKLMIAKRKGPIHTYNI